MYVICQKCNNRVVLATGTTRCMFCGAPLHVLRRPAVGNKKPLL
jgi:hypothetical protein